MDDVKKLSPGIDVKNQFLRGAYFGMTFFVEALKKVGPNLTRAELKKVLDSMDYKTDLASDLSWRPGKHHANVRARSFSVVYGEEPSTAGLMRAPAGGSTRRLAGDL